MCSKLRRPTMRSVDDIVLNLSLRKLKTIFVYGIVRIELACCFFRCTRSLYPSIAFHYSIAVCVVC